MAAAVDEDGNDIRLAEAVARMTPEQCSESEENLRRWVEAARASLKRAKGVTLPTQFRPDDIFAVLERHGVE